MGGRRCGKHFLDIEGGGSPDLDASAAALELIEKIVPPDGKPELFSMRTHYDYSTVHTEAALAAGAKLVTKELEYHEAV